MKASSLARALVAALTMTASLVTTAAAADEDGGTAAATVAAPEADTASVLRAATEALASEHPNEAIAQLEALSDRGVVDPVLSFDRGLAYAARVRARAEQPGDLGRAAHGFEEARELSSDPALVSDATNALSAVRAEVARRRSRAGDPIELDSGVSLGRSIVRLLPENVWAALAGLASLALVIGILVRYRAEARRAKVAGTTTASIAGGLLVLLAIVVSAARDERLRLREAVVVAPNARLLDDKRVALVGAAALPEGARLQLLDEQGDFARVVSGRTEGYLPSSAILPMAKR